MGRPVDDDNPVLSLSELAGVLSDSEADTIRAAIAASHRQHNEQVDWEPPAPVLDGSLPSDEVFYIGEIPEWTPDQRTNPTE